MSGQTWRNHESGRTRVRGDKQIGVWETLGWELPDEWAGRADTVSRLGYYGSMADGPMLGGPVDDEDGLPDLEHLVKQALVSSCALESVLGADADALKVSEWDEIPTLLAAGYSPVLARMLEENAAR